MGSSWKDPLEWVWGEREGGGRTRTPLFLVRCLLRTHVGQAWTAAPVSWRVCVVTSWCRAQGLLHSRESSPGKGLPCPAWCQTRQWGHSGGRAW